MITPLLFSLLLIWQSSAVLIVPAPVPAIAPAPVVTPVLSVAPVAPVVPLRVKRQYYGYPAYGYYNPLGTGSPWAAGGGVVGNTLSFLVGK